MSKEREKILNKYGGKCYLCGIKLGNKWHVDHKEPIRRGHYTIDGMLVNQHLDIFENKFPCCGSCNINKHSDSLEVFRRRIKAYMYHLNNISTQYKIAKRYGLVIEQDIPVKFYFEQFIN